MLFRLPLRMILLLYGEYIVHLHISAKEGDLYKENVYIICNTQKYLFSSVLFRVLLTPLLNGHECRANINDDASI